MKELESYCGTIDDTIYAYVEDYNTLWRSLICQEMPAWTIPYSKSGVLPMPAFTKRTSFQTLETFQTMYITKQIPCHSLS